jgi:hypothetical protein
MVAEQVGLKKLQPFPSMWYTYPQGGNNYERIQRKRHAVPWFTTKLG